MKINVVDFGFMLGAIGLFTILFYGLMEWRKALKEKPTKMPIKNQSDLELLYALQSTVDCLKESSRQISQLFVPEVYKNILKARLNEEIQFLQCLKNSIEINHSGDKPISNKQWAEYLELALHQAGYHEDLTNKLDILRKAQMVETQNYENSAMTGNPVIERQEGAQYQQNKTFRQELIDKRNKHREEDLYRGLDL